MIELSRNQKELLTNFTNSLENNNIQYVILRRHEFLPEGIPGTQEKDFDVDLLIESESFNQAIEIAFKTGITKKERSSPTITELIYRGLINPSNAINELIYSPKELATTIIQSGSESAGISHDSSYYNQACDNGYGFPLRADGLPLDTKCHLAHNSPLDGSRIRLDPKIEEKMLSNRIINDSGIYIPSAEDELAHIVTHMIFEYEGELTPYYEERISELVDIVYSDEEKQTRVRDLFDIIFFEAGELVSNRTQQKEVQGLFDSLKRFDDY